MNQEPKKNDNEEINTQEELDELKEVMKKLKELQDDNKQKQKKKPRQPIIAIEFGGVFHKNRYINLLFSALVNFIFAYFVIEIFDFAEYHGKIYVLILLMAIYTIIEEIYRNLLLRHYFDFIIKSFGSVFFFGYVLIFFVLDQYVFIEEFNFFNGTVLAFFVLIFVLTRYFFGTSVRRYFRKKRI